MCNQMSRYLLAGIESFSTVWANVGFILLVNEHVDCQVGIAKKTLPTSWKATHKVSFIEVRPHVLLCQTRTAVAFGAPRKGASVPFGSFCLSGRCDSPRFNVGDC